MANIKDPAAIAAKWSRVTPQRSEDYQAGIQSPRQDWQQATQQSETVYKQAVTEAAAQGRFGKGVAKAGSQKWQLGALNKGVQRWGPGVQVAQADYAAGFAPYAQTIQSTALPPRYAKGDIRNLERTKAITTALHKRKISG